MKKSMAVITAVLMLLMSACSGGGGSSPSPAATQPAAQETSQAGTESSAGASLIVSWWGNQTRNERTQGALDLYTEQNPGIEIDGQFSEWSDYWNKLATAAAGKSLPDVLQMDYAYLEQYVSNGLLLDLTPYIENGTLDVSNVSESVLDSGRVGDGIYAITIGINGPSMFYNKTLLEENDITIKDNMTLDEFIDKCREIYEKTGYKTALPYNVDLNFTEALLRGVGVQLYEENKLGGAEENYEIYYGLLKMGLDEGWHISPGVLAERAFGSVEQSSLVYGSSPENMSWCAMHFSNQLTAMQNAAPEGVEIGITTWPTADPKLSSYLKPSQFFSVSADTSNPEEAVKVVDYWTNSVECNEILLAERGIPASSVVADAITPLLAETEQLVSVYINEVVSPNCSPINPPMPEKASEVMASYKAIEERLAYGETDVVSAAQEFYAEGNRILGGN